MCYTLVAAKVTLFSWQCDTSEMVKAFEHSAERPRCFEVFRSVFRALRVLVMFLEVPRSPGLGTCHSHGAT